MDRYIAIDNVCAWPNLTLLRDGSIIATIFNQPCHGTWEGDVECWGSQDGGRSWKLRGTPAAHEPTTNRMNVAAGMAGNGDLIVIASGWSDRPPKGTPRGHGDARVLRPWVSRSSDGGRTWEVRKAFPSAPEPEMCELIPFGDVLAGAEGTLGVCTYAGKLDAMRNYNSCYFHRSRDGGMSWDGGVIIAAGDFNETTPLHLGGGRWLAAARSLKQQALFLHTSQDDGKTWQFAQPLALPYQHPANLIRLSDGRVLLTYGNRCQGQPGIDVRISEDEGRSWSRPAQLLSLEQTDLGYPSTVQTAEGKLVTAYYASQIAQHARYHMGVMCWEIDELFPKG